MLYMENIVIRASKQVYLSQQGEKNVSKNFLLQQNIQK